MLPMQHDDIDRDNQPSVHQDQLAIDVAPAPKARGRWTAQDEIDAYAEAMGRDRAQAQVLAAREAKKCTCRAQAKEDELARTEKRKSKRVPSAQHSPGCPQYRPISATRHVPTETEYRREMGR